MTSRYLATVLLGIALVVQPAYAGQVPFTAVAPHIPISHRDRFYTSNQFSNTVSVIDPVDNKLLGVIRTLVISTADHSIVGRVKQDSPFCPDIAATPDGKQVWLTLKDIGLTMVFNAAAPFNLLKVIDTGPITNHVNILRNANGQFAYVTVGGLNMIKVFRADDFTQIAKIPVGALPHGLWPSGVGSRVYVGLENADGAAVIDTLKNMLITTIPIGQAAQGVAYVPGAVPTGAGTQNLQPLGIAGNAAHPVLGPPDGEDGLVQVLQAAVSDLQPKQPYLLALGEHADGSGKLEPIVAFVTNPAGAAIVDGVGPIRQVVQDPLTGQCRYLVIASGAPDKPGPPVQVRQ